mmetsp:Transcript_4155/g.7972  ORF Transcript_4155/g.7972 Transcript_4155/m.7972 type:complete len:348 (+) Transcript_4155:195-1238(+)|eukprot:CAMPEP_0196133486 /NCGR_PEP_ID=MMETSP0910-20130528/2693_1 /TAXON_ID=49265 /ORGANISM="Thalassiosira rotula, Strain GSO102" /LENGTH=347 /DNA_ID=CAMNT_0041393217 /DNA_START=143 /DNA_END=1186 /DNA_ORIENTATION=-
MRRLAATALFSFAIFLAEFHFHWIFNNDSKNYSLSWSRNKIDIRGNASNSSPQEEQTPKYSILPKKIYSVIGLESSGTQFVSKILQDALNMGPYREGSLPCCVNNCTDDNAGKATLKRGFTCHENNDIMVQHFSLPWGSVCRHHPNPIVDVVLPPQCTRNHHNDPTLIQECNAMAHDLWNIQLDGEAMQYPIRYQLDIVKSKEWYDAQGVEQVFVIVMRDKGISFAARRSHCGSVELRQQEEEVGTKIIEDAIRRYVLEKEGKGGENETQSLLWDVQQYQGNNRSRQRRLGSRDVLSSNNGVVIVSYESLIKLGGTYVEMLYNALGIESNALVPEIRNGNEKYLKTK